VVGRWRESTRGAVGTVTGSVKGDRVDVRVEGQTFSAVLSLVTRGDKQSISIQAPVGAQMSSANITLRRG
jgi:membrane protein implicated in regulation of membrane protease activity